MKKRDGSQMGEMQLMRGPSIFALTDRLTYVVRATKEINYKAVCLPRSGNLLI